jgi:hypothetical protein
MHEARSLTVGDRCYPITDARRATTGTVAVRASGGAGSDAVRAASTSARRPGRAGSPTGAAGRCPAGLTTDLLSASIDTLQRAPTPHY